MNGTEWPYLLECRKNHTLTRDLFAVENFLAYY